MHAPNRSDRFHALTLLGVMASLCAGIHSAVAQPTPGPAPLPAVVAIPRPAPSEVAQVNESLKKFLSQTDTATKAILDKYPELLTVQAPRPNSAIVPSLNPGFRTKHSNNLEVAKKGDIDLLFMGDSITDGWRSGGKAIFDQYYGALKPANFGIGGDTTQGVLYRLQDGEGQGFKPKAIMLMIGTNNTGRNSPPEIAEAIGAIILEMRKDFPDAKILLLAIFPRSNPGDPVRAAIADINGRISKLDDGKNVFYLDIGSKFLNAEGVITREIMGDLLHPTAKGYEIWAEAVKEPLAKLLK